jgi:integrase
MSTKPLTAAAVLRFKPGAKRRRIPDLGTPSLFLIIEPSGRKSWGMRFRVGGGRIGKITLGPVDLSGKGVPGEPVIGKTPLTLAGARRLAAKIHHERDQGLDPVAEHKARKHRQRTEIKEREAPTFAAAAKAYVDEYAQPKIRRWHEVAKVLGFDYPNGGGEPEMRKQSLVERWADKLVGEIDSHLIWSVIDEARRVGIPGIPAKTKGTSEARARSVCAALSGMWGWLRGQRHRYTVGNPFADITRPDPAGKRERVLSHAEIRWFWHACDSADGPRVPGARKPFAPLLRLLQLTGSRLNEVAGMRRDELHEDGSWHLPGSRSKNRKPHITPLSPLARQQLDTMKGRGDLIFTTNGRTQVSGFSRMKARLDEAMLEIARAERGDTATIPGWTLHDLRRTAVTCMSEDLGIREAVIEKTVNHLSGVRGGIAGVYNKAELLPERRIALAAWARFVELVIDKDLHAAHQRLIADNDEHREQFQRAVLKGNDEWGHYLATLAATNVIPMRSRREAEIAS